jgi:Protein of unknown function (DUF2911)
MRPLRFTFAMISAALATLPVVAQQTRISPHETLSVVFGDRHTGNRVTLTYGRPYTRDPKTGEPRKIWGDLVPWASAYRLGADEATLLVTQQPITFGNTTVPAGAYTLYMVPSEKGTSRLAISTNIGKWGIPVDEAHDRARVDLKKDTLAQPVDQLTLAIDKGDNGDGMLKIMWENTQYSVALHSEGPGVDFPAASPTADVKERVGVADIEINYSRPSLKGRVMIGEIDPYGVVWRTGANNATRITFSTPVTLQGKPIDAGTYELFTIPNKDEWTIILQKPTHQWGAYAYDAKNDVARVTANPVAVADPVETFTIDISAITKDSAVLDLVWDRVRVPVKLQVDVVGLIRPKIDAAMAAPGKKPYVQAALFYYDYDLDLRQAAEWIGDAIAEQPGAYYLLYQKARILAKSGDRYGAQAAAQESIDLAAKGSEPAKSEYLRLNEALLAGLK